MASIKVGEQVVLAHVLLLLAVIAGGALAAVVAVYYSRLAAYFLGALFLSACIIGLVYFAKNIWRKEQALKQQG
jgi:hypothetical protein